MSDWKYDVEKAVERYTTKGAGATGARCGILGLPLPVDASKKDRSCHKATAEARDRVQETREKRQKPLLPMGSTGLLEYDSKLDARPVENPASALQLA